MLKQLQARTAVQPLGFSYGVWLIIIWAIGFIIWFLYRAFFQPAWLVALPALLQEFIDLVEAATAASLIFILIVLIWHTSRPPRQPQAERVPILTVEQLYALSPGAFEGYVGLLFQQKGYKATLRGGSGDLGVDIELQNRQGKRAIVQCKRYRTTVGSDTVRELFGTLIHEKAAHAFLVTTADISDAARSWAKHKPLTLIDGDTLVQIALSLYDKQQQN